MPWTWYNIKQLGVAVKKTDAKGVTTGPTYDRLIDWDGAKKLGLNLTLEQIVLLGNGVPRDTQSNLSGVDIAVETGILTPDVEAALYNMTHMEKADESVVAWTDASFGQYVGLWARTDQVGTNGEDVVLWIPSAQFATLNKDVSENAHRNLVYNGKCDYTRSLYELEEVNKNTGVLETVYRKIIFLERNRRASAAASLFDPEVGYLTVSTSFPINNHPVANNIVIKFNRSLKRASINKSTVLFKQAGTPVGFTLSVSTDTLTDDTLTINPTPATLDNGTAYTVTLKEALQDIHDNHLEADLDLVVNTVAA